MQILPTPLEGLHVIETRTNEDERGAFARFYCRDTFASWGLVADFVQTSASWNTKRSTLRGMHFQRSPHAETKLVRCVQGRIWDVAIDLRKASPTRCQWFGLELSGGNRRALYIPEGFAHGFITLDDRSLVLYQISVPYEPTSASGVRWNDPAFAISWPAAPVSISERDQAFPDFRP